MFTRFTSFAAVLSALRRRRSSRTEDGDVTSIGGRISLASIASSLFCGNRHGRRRGPRFSLSCEFLEPRIVPAVVSFHDTDTFDSPDSLDSPQRLPSGGAYQVTGTLTLDPGSGVDIDAADFFAITLRKGQILLLDASPFTVGTSLYDPDHQVLAPDFASRTYRVQRDGVYQVVVGLAFTGVLTPETVYSLAIVVDGKDIQAKTLQWDTAKKGVTVSYENSVKLDKATKGALYWATGTTADTIIDKSKPAYTFNLDKTAGTHEKSVALTSLKKPPTKNKGGVTEAMHLLLVLDPVSADKPQGVIVESDETNNLASLTRKFDSDIFFAEVSKRLGKLSASQQEGLTYLIDKLVSDFNVIADPRQVAYILATAKWETAHTLKPIYEIPPKSIAGDAAKIEAYFNDKYSGRADLGNTESTDGFTYRGRGYVQLTGRKNYKQIGDVVGVDLETNPDAALSPNTAYTIMTLGMQQGLFTGKSISDYITDDKTDYVNARRVINGTDKAGPISSLAKKFETILRNSVIPK